MNSLGYLQWMRSAAACVSTADSQKNAGATVRLRRAKGEKFDHGHDTLETPS